MAEADIQLQLDAVAGVNLSLTKSLNTQFTGCMDTYTSLAVTAGATANFFNVFSKSTSVSLWSKKFDLWNVSLRPQVPPVEPIIADWFALLQQKCFSKQREHARAFPARPQSLVKRGQSLTCAGLQGPPKLQMSVTQPVSAAR